MKILRIGIFNLNSLVGHQEIDFRREPLRSAGLYAIVGPTGAGKSTILDAITLALYGKTERDNTGSEVMSHGTGECFAEVEYETRTGTYLSRWERRRSRQKPDGNLQTAQRQLSRWNPEAEEYQPLDADLLAEVNERTVEVIGLDYDRFVRSVMLTQGQFARFLHSSLRERADVLEKITGTEIYSQISEAAFNRHKQARVHYDQLRDRQGHSDPLPEADRAQLEAELVAVKERVLHLRPRQQSIRETLARLDQQDALLERQHHLRLQEEVLRKSAEKLFPVREALRESLRLSPLREPLLRRQSLHQEVEKEEQELRRLLTRQTFVEARVAEERQAARGAEEAQSAFATAKPDKLEALRKATELENSLTVLGREADQRALRLAELAKNRKEIGERLSAVSTERDLLVAQLGTEDATTIGRQLEVTEARLEELQREQPRVAAWAERWGLEEQKERITREVAEISIRREVAAAQLAQLQQDATRDEQTVESRRRILHQVEQSKGLEPLRAQTRPGQACALCGSLHHPALEHHQPVTDNDILVASQDLDSARSKFESTREAVTAAADTLQTLTTQLAVRRGAGERVQEQLKQIKVSGPVPPSPAVARESLAQMEQERAACAETCGELRRKRSRAEALLALQPRVAALRHELDVYERQATQLQRDGMSGEEEVARLAARKQSLIGQSSSQDYRNDLERMEARVREAWSLAHQAVERGQGELHLALELVTSTQKRLDDLRGKEQAAQAVITDLLARFALPSATVAAAALLDPATEEQYRERLRSLEVDQEAQQRAATEVASELASVKSALAKQSARTELDDELHDLIRETSMADQQRGGIEKEIQQDEQRRSVHALLLEEMKKAERELQRWARLNDLIGQQSGVKFSRFAQTLTLQRLVEVGNRHLLHISERYRMRHKVAAELGKETLELEIIDTYQNDNRRPMSTLSGGETFLVSLALALGLSELASGRTNIQSLFIDEGFGTLDERVLDQAVSALEQLEHQGKTIGLISHVRELRERIHCQIQLSARGNGRSQLEVTVG